MQLTLSKQDIMHAVSLQWEAVRRSREWRTVSFDYRATLRERHAKYREKVCEMIRRRGGEAAVFDLSVELVDFARKTARRQLMSSYFWGLFLFGWLFGLVGLVAVELCAQLLTGRSVDIVTAYAVMGPLMAVFPAAGIAWARGAWKTLRLVRHARRARQDPAYLLPKPHRF